MRRPYFGGSLQRVTEERGAGRARRSGVVVDVAADEGRGFDDRDDGDGDVLLWLRTTDGGWR